MTPDYSTFTDPEAAIAITREVRQWAAAESRRFARIGLQCWEVERRLLWQHVATDEGVPFASFGGWMSYCIPGEPGEQGVPKARSTAYEARRVRKEMLDIPEKDFAQISHGNLYTLRDLSTTVRSDPAVLVQAKTLGREAFEIYVSASQPDQHREPQSSLRFRPTVGDKAIILRAIEEAIRDVYGATREEVLLGWALNWLQEQEEAVPAHREVVQ